MKRKFSWVATLFIGIVCFVTSCANSSQITFEDSNKKGLTNDGLSELTVQFNQGVSKAAFLPDDWTEGQKSTLLFKLTGTVESGTATVDLNNAGTAAIFTWDEIKNGKAIINLDPKIWNLTLSAYQVASLDKTTTLDNKNIVLESAKTKVDLTAGGTTQEFAMKPKTDTSSTATGDIDVTVKFHKEALAEIASAKFSLCNKEDTAIENGITTATNDKISFAEGDFAKIGPDDYCSITATGKAKPGEYLLKLEFTNKKGQVIDTERWPIRIEGNNRSGGSVKIDKGSFASVPVQPTDLKVTTTFVPKDNKVDLFVPETKTTISAQEVDANALPEKAPEIQTTYNAKFEWTRQSYNEDEFELVITVNDGTDKTITVNKASPEIISGSLNPGSETVGISIPTGTEIKGFTVAAKNSINTTNPITPTEYINPEPTKKIGMFTVTYGLTTYSFTESKLCNIVYSADGKTEKETTKEYFVMAYDFGTTADALINIGPEYPCLKMNQTVGLSESYRFGGWRTFTEDPKVYNNPTLSPDDVVLNDKNITVYPTWTSPLSIKVTFPGGLQKYETLDVVNDNNHILPAKINTTTPLVIKVTDKVLTEGDTISNYKYKVTKNDGSTEPTVLYDTLKEPPAPVVNVDNKFDSATAGTLEWTTDTATNGDYIVYIQYDYTSGSDTVTIGGSIHVKLDVADQAQASDPAPAP